MTGCTTKAHQSFLFNVVWSLQMPRFILISGYVTRYSHQIENGTELWKFLKRRTIAYLLPWIVWSLLVRGIVFGQYDFLNIKWLLWHMNSGYWFLVTIWTINMIFGISVFCANKTLKTANTTRMILFFLLFCTGAGILAGIVFLTGLSFFAIKLTLYYIPFFLLGYLFGQYQDDILKTRFGKKIIDFVVAVSLATWLFIILQYCIFDLPDSGLAVVLRAVTSITGCIAVCGLCNGVFANEVSILCKCFSWTGIHSLEIYLIHYLLLDLLLITPSPVIGSIRGMSLISANYILTLILVVITIQGLNSNKLIKFFLFGSR